MERTMLAAVLLCLIITSSFISAIPLPDTVEQSKAEVHPREKRWLSLFTFIGKMAFGKIFKRATKGKSVVEVKNWIPGSNIDVHCKSGTDDVGSRTVGFEDDYNFDFRDFFGRTHYWCNVWWNGRHRKFPAYGEGAPRTDNSFDIKESGIFRNGVKLMNW